ncbi:MAG: glycosyltransferase family 2 protein [Tissierella sp.]|nr:glycosyltransferase family 2 protein [Tissierella sp.]
MSNYKKWRLEMSKLPKISVIIPVYNVEEYLRQCLDSVINQTLQDIEIICVNDESTDDSLAILEEYAKRDSRINVLSQKNAGAGAARNKGLEIARGEYLSFLDSDDFFELDMLEKAYNKVIGDNADIVIYKVQLFNDKTKMFSDAPWAFNENYFPPFVPFSYKDMPKYIFNSFQNWTWNKLFRKAFVDRNKLRYQELRRTNDLLFTCMALVTAERITLLDEVLAYYRCGTQTNSQATNHIAPLDFYKAFFTLKQELIRIGIFEEVEQSYSNWALVGCIYNLNSLRDKKTYEKLYSLLRNEGFEELGISKHSRDYYHNKANYYAYVKIKKMPFSKFTYEKNKIINLIFYNFLKIVYCLK